MPVFRLLTSVIFRDNLVQFKDSTISQIAKILDTEEKYVTLDIKHSLVRKNTGGPHLTRCRVTYFEEFCSTMMKDILSQAALELKRLLQNSFGEQKFYISYSSCKDKVLIDWTERSEVIASMPTGNQGDRKNCWAYVAAFITSCAYSQENPSVEDLAEITCSPQDLSDWVYCFLELETDVDEYGHYGANGGNAFTYIQTCGVSLLKNYEIAEYKAKKIETAFDIGVFKEMWHTRGDRIFIDKYEYIYPDTSILGKPSFSLELVTKILHQGIAYGSIFYCAGCSLCKGFDRFTGEGVYDEPSHPEGHEYKRHAVAVIGAGNLGGKDYVRIRNTRGASWAKNGEADMHIKFFKALIQVSGAKKKKLAKTDET